MQKTKHRFQLVSAALGSVVLLSLVALYSCASQRSKGAATAAEAKAKAAKAKAAAKLVGMSDGELSLRKQNVLENSPVLERGKFNDEDPGDNRLIPTAFHDAPPMIPHSVAWSVGKTITANECLDCHMAGTDGATKLPRSHRLEAKMKKAGKKAKGQVFFVEGYQEVKKVSGWRFDCRLCHAGQATNLKPLVKTTFKRQMLK